jgi:hypothetical protein
MPAIQHSQANPADPTGQLIKAWSSQAGTLAGKHDFAQALALLDIVETALKRTAAGAVPGTAPAVLKSITITPANPSLVGGWQRQFKAMGTYSDASSKDVTTAVHWSSSADGIVAINNRGLATAHLVAGSAIITAADPRNPVIAASTTATVTLDPVPALPPDEQSKADRFADM